MNEYLKMADVFELPIDEIHIGIEPICVVDDLDDVVIPHEYAVHAINHHDSIVSKLEVTAQALIDSCSDVVKLKKEIERLSLVNSEIIDAIDCAVSSEDMQPVRAMRKKYIID